MTVRATDDAVCVNDRGVERRLAWGAATHLRVLTGTAFLELVSASHAFDVLSWHPERSRDSGVSEFEPRPWSLPPVGRCMVALRRR